jgi:rod shape-determining protein MreD
MKPSIWRKLDTLARQLMPCAMTLAMLIAGVVPLHIPAFESVAPAMPLIAVFYWSLHRPDLMPAWAAFVLGLLQDIFAGLPLGVSACALIAVHAAVNTQRRFFVGKSFGVVWLGFTVVASAAVALSWVLTCVSCGALLAPEAALFQSLITIGVFPILSRVLLRCQLAVLRHV